MSISFTVGRERIRFAGKTDVGKVRAHNEDNVLVPTQSALAAVADGMGGHASGEVASAIAVETIESYYQATDDDGAATWPLRLPQIDIERDRIVTAIKLSNSKIFDTGVKDPEKKGMGCTVDAIYFSQGRYYIGHVGDSRVYRIHRGQMQQLTEDHSLLNDWRRMKEMSGAEVEAFPHKNVVVRALGLGEHVAVDVIVDEFHVGDIYLLCSDGLSGMLEDDQMNELVAAHESLDQACTALVAAANEAGGNDNISVVLARVEPA